MDVAPLGDGDKSVFDFPGDAAAGIGEQSCEFIFKIIALIGLADEVQHGQAFFIFRKPQTTPQLLEENGQRFRRAKEQYRIDFWNVHAFVVNIHHKDEANGTADQPIFGGCPLFLRGFTGEENRGNAMVVKVTAHELGVFNGYAESQSFHLIDVGHIFQNRGNHQVCPAIG